MATGSTTIWYVAPRVFGSSPLAADGACCAAAAAEVAAVGDKSDADDAWAPGAPVGVLLAPAPLASEPCSAPPEAPPGCAEADALPPVRLPALVLLAFAMEPLLVFGAGELGGDVGGAARGLGGVSCDAPWWCCDIGRENLLLLNAFLRESAAEASGFAAAAVADAVVVAWLACSAACGDETLLCPFALPPSSSVICSL